MACAAGRRGQKRGFAPVDCPKIATLTLVRQHGQHHAGLGSQMKPYFSCSSNTEFEGYRSIWQKMQMKFCQQKPKRANNNIPA
jgi:hypothetical protein